MKINMVHSVSMCKHILTHHVSWFQWQIAITNMFALNKYTHVINYKLFTVPKMIKTRSSTCSMTSSSEVRYCLLMLTTGSILGSQALWYTGLNYNNRHLLLITGIIRKNNKMAKIMEFKIFYLWCIGLSLKFGFNNVFVLLNH